MRCTLHVYFYENISLLVTDCLSLPAGSDVPPSNTTLATSLGGTTWRGVTPSGMMGGVPGMAGMTISKALNPGAGLLGEYHGRDGRDC